jgi:biotin carboxylase
MGFHVTCLDGTKNAPGLTVANQGFTVPLQDLKALIHLAREQAPDIVLTEQTDFTVPIAARIAQALALRGLPVDVADAATHKGLMRERARAAGVCQPRFRVCRSLVEVALAAREIGLPLFHKPVDGQSSRGVGILPDDSATAMSVAWERSASSSRLGMAIFEEVLRGTECTVEGFVVDGRPVTLAISSKEHYPDLPGVARSLTYPADFPEAVLRRIAEANEAVVRALGIPFGITHAEFVVDSADQPWLVEVAARGGGSLIASHIVPALTGFHPTVALIRGLMGQRVEVAPACLRAAQLRFLRLPSGRRVRRYANVEELRRRTGVLELAFQVPAGADIAPVADDRSRHGFVITHADTRSRAVALASEVERDLLIDFQT